MNASESLLLSVPWWGIGVLVRAVSEALGVWLWVLLALLGLWGISAALGKWERTDARRVMTATGLAVLFGAAAWALRDRNLLLGDARLYIESAEVFGAGIHTYRAPVAIWFLGLLTEAGGGVVSAGAIFAGVSVLSGLIFAALLSRVAPPSLAFPLAFLLPLSLVFFGHPEVYPLFLAALAAALVAVRGDFERGRLSPATLAAVALVCALHVLGMILAVTLAAAWWVDRGARGRRFVLALILLAAAGVAVAWFIPAARGHLTVARAWSASTAGAYVVELLNGWLVLGLPAGVVVFRARRGLMSRPYTRFLLGLLAAYACFPLVGLVELGLYRDIDLLAPAWGVLVFLAAEGVRDLGGRTVRLVLLTGLPLLAAWITLTLTPLGAEELRRRTDASLGPVTARSYSYETLAFYHREREDLAAAEDLMRRAVDTTPGNLRLWGPLGEIQLERGDSLAAIASLERTLGTPRVVRSLPLMLEILVRSGRGGEAIGLYEDHAAVVVGSSTATAAVSVALSQRQRYRDLEALCRNRLSRDGGDDVARFNLASALAATGRVDEALDELLAAVRLAPARVDYALAAARLMLGFPDGEDRVNGFLASLPPDVATAVARGLGLLP